MLTSRTQGRVARKALTTIYCTDMTDVLSVTSVCCDKGIDEHTDRITDDSTTKNTTDKKLNLNPYD
jgi:hypothetical protein